MTTTFDTARFAWSHGAAPKGIGTWIFEDPDGETVAVYGTFTEARAAVRRAHPSITRWVVLP